MDLKEKNYFKSINKSLDNNKESGEDILGLEFFKNFLKFEEENSWIWNYEHNGIHFWPIIRTNNLFVPYFNQEFEFSESHASITHSGLYNKIKKNINQIVSATLYNPFLSFKNPKIIAISTARYRIYRDGVWFDRMFDYIREVEKDLLILENLYRDGHRYHRYCGENSKNMEYFSIKTAFSRWRSKSINGIDEFYNKLSKALRDSGIKINDENLNLDRIETPIRNFITYAPVIDKYLKRFKPKLIFINQASYVGINAVIIHRCKLKGITVAEFQHGQVGKYHPAYNYSERLNDVFKTYLPDYFLTFGDTWRKNLDRFPMKKIVIGSPHMDYILKTYIKKRKEEKNKNVLIVSQGAITNVLVDFTLKLRRILPKNYNIIYKLHPGEIPFVERYQSLKNKNGITIIGIHDIYELINESEIIVGMFSTTVFEAIAFNKPVFIISTPITKAVIPKKLGIFVNNPDDILDFLTRNKSNQLIPKIEPAQLWAPNWRSNLKEFLDLAISS